MTDDSSYSGTRSLVYSTWLLRRITVLYRTVFTTLLSFTASFSGVRSSAYGFDLMRSGVFVLLFYASNSNTDTIAWYSVGIRNGKLRVPFYAEVT